jgi:hypothetical protein
VLSSRDGSKFGSGAILKVNSTPEDIIFSVAVVKTCRVS